MRITTTKLRNKHACEDQILIFEKEWGKGCEVTLPNLLRAVGLGLDLHWFSTQCLPKRLRARYEAEESHLWARYEAEEAPLRARYLAEEALRARYFTAEYYPFVYDEREHLHHLAEEALWARYLAEVAPLRARRDAEVARLIDSLINKKVQK